MRIGSTWIAPEYIQQFMYELLNTSWRNQELYKVICSLIPKFGIRTKTRNGDDLPEAQVKKSIEQFIIELKAALPTDFKAKGDFVVFVDECHRTQSGFLHKAMEVILPNAIFIGFTGTPLLVKDKKTSIEVFSPGYIHTYKYDEAVTDCKYYEIFQSRGFRQCAIVILFPKQNKCKLKRDMI